MANVKPNQPTADIKRRLLAGEPLTSAQCVAEYGVSDSLMSTVVGALEREGVTLARTAPPVGGHKSSRTYTVTDPAPGPALVGTWGPAAGVRKHGNRGGKGKPRAVANSTNGAVAPVRSRVNGKYLATDHPVPVLGESLQVFLLALTDDGRVNVGLRDGEKTWLTTVDGFSASP